ncbi:MAG: TOBE domain-containing protein, partial [Pseudomonadota bacterium]
GAPPMNLLPAEMTDNGIELGGYRAPHDAPHRGSITLGIRPERAHLNGHSDGIQLDVGIVEELGAHRLIHGTIGTHEVTITQDAELPVPEGRVGLSFRHDDLHLFDPQSGQRM